MIKQGICWAGGQCLRTYDQVQRFAKSFFPSQVVEVHHYPTATSESEVVYCAKSPFSRWESAFCSNMYLSNEGFYRIHVWNSNTCVHQSYYLSSKHLEKALNSQNLFSWWAMTDFGIVTMISSYIAMMQATNTHVVGVLINGEDVTHLLKPYFSSICLTRNCTAHSLCALYNDMVGVHPKKWDHAEVVILDYDMTEHKKVNDEWLFE